MAKKTKEEIRAKWQKLGEIYEEREAHSIALETAYDKLVAKIRRSEPEKVAAAPEDQTFGKLAELWEEIRVAHNEERSAQQDRDIYAKKAVERGAVSESELPKVDIFNTRGVHSQEKHGISRTLYNPDIEAGDGFTAHTRELLEGELAAWADISPSEARELFVEQAGEDVLELSFDERAVGLFQQHGAQWKKDRVFLDLETTALDPYLGEIIEVGIVRVDPSGKIVQKFEERFDIEREDARNILGVGASELHRIWPEDLEGKRKFSDPEVQKELGAILNADDIVLVAHHAAFEHSFLAQHLDGYHAAHIRESGESLRRRRKTFEHGTPRILTTDTRVLCTYLTRSPNNKLEVFSTANGVSKDEYEKTAHGAYADADMTRRTLWNFRETMQKMPRGNRQVIEGYKPNRRW